VLHQSKEASILWSHYEQTGSCLVKEIIQGTMPGTRRRGRPRTTRRGRDSHWKCQSK